MAKPSIEQIVREIRERRFGVSSETLELIGYGSLLWNTIELQLLNLITTIASWNRETGRVVVIDLQNVSRVQLARNLLALSSIDKAVITHTEALLLLFDQVRSSRNAIIHGIPFTRDTGLEDGLVVRLEAKRGDGSIKISELMLTKDYMDKFIFAAELLSLSLEHTYELVTRDRKYRRSPSLRRAHKYEDYVWQGAGRGPEAPALTAARVSLLPPPPVPKAHRKSR